MSARVHPTAVVDPGAVLGADVVIDAFCYVGPDVEIGPATRLFPHAVILGPLRLGRGNRVHSHACLGAEPQDRSFGGELTEVSIGDDNEFRESVTVHRGTRKGGGTTQIGSHCLFMVGAHVAHDCRVGDGVTLANYTSLGGHVHVESGVVSGGHVAIAPFCRIGRLAFVAGGSMVERDVPPFVIAEGNRARVRALNRVGLRRFGICEASQRALERAFRMIYASGVSRDEAVLAVGRELGTDPQVAHLVEALRRPARHARK